MILDGVLGGNHKKWAGNLTETPSTVTCCSSITRADWVRGVVNFIRKQNVGKYWTREIFKFATLGFPCWYP